MNETFAKASLVNNDWINMFECFKRYLSALTSKGLFFRLAASRTQPIN